MHIHKTLAVLCLALAACTSVFLVFTLKPTTWTAHVIFTGWLCLPYAAMLCLLLRGWKARLPGLSRSLAVTLVSMAGLLFLLDTVVWRPDAQGAIAVLMIPMIQGGLLAIVLPVLKRWVPDPSH
ncbi:MAG: hypothetical protein KA439_10275 [Rhizobacter sp.]|nr:hypothetical protein [Rhizobacter sp.]